jgi:hypothetical protein
MPAPWSASSATGIHRAQMHTVAGRTGAVRASIDSVRTVLASSDSFRLVKSVSDIKRRARADRDALAKPVIPGSEIPIAQF